MWFFAEQDVLIPLKLVTTWIFKLQLLKTSNHSKTLVPRIFTNWSMKFWFNLVSLILEMEGKKPQTNKQDYYAGTA